MVVLGSAPRQPDVGISVLGRENRDGEAGAGDCYVDPDGAIDADPGAFRDSGLAAAQSRGVSCDTRSCDRFALLGAVGAVASQLGLVSGVQCSLASNAADHAGGPGYLVVNLVSQPENRRSMLHLVNYNASRVPLIPSVDVTLGSQQRKVASKRVSPDFAKEQPVPPWLIHWGFTSACPWLKRILRSSSIPTGKQHRHELAP